MSDALPHPRKTLVTREAAREWEMGKSEIGKVESRNPDRLYQRKYDGELARVRIGGGATVLAEFMRPKSGGFFTAADRAMHARFPLGWWAAITVEELHGENVLHESTAWRWAHLKALAPKFAPDMILAEVVTDVDAAFANGAEGCVGHAWGAPWGDMVAVKQAGVWMCRVTSVGSTQSVSISRLKAKGSMLKENSGKWENLEFSIQPSDFVPAGRVKLGGGKVDQVRVGSIIRVEGMGLTDAGKIRQPVACREWLVKF